MKQGNDGPTTIKIASLKETIVMKKKLKNHQPMFRPMTKISQPPLSYTNPQLVGGFDAFSKSKVGLKLKGLFVYLLDVRCEYSQRGVDVTQEELQRHAFSYATKQLIDSTRYEF